MNQVMRRCTTLSLILIFVTAALAPLDGFAANRVNIGINGGVGLPVGWWGDRWGMFANSELNVRYEFNPGLGLLVITGLDKGYVTKMSKEQVATEARQHLQSEFTPYSKIMTASQDGSFQQIPIGFGIYYERLITPPRLRGYGSLAMVVHLWKAQRNQDFTAVVDPPVEGFTGTTTTDNWRDDISSADVGGQAVLGITYQLNKVLYIDASVAYHYVRVEPKNNAIAFWGKPARTWSPDRWSDATGQADLLQFRLGIRLGS